MPPELKDVLNSIAAEDKHPFLNGLPKDGKEIPPDDQVAAFRQWVVQQPDFPVLTDNYLRLFLHCCYGKQPLAQKTLRRYLKIRTKNPDIFSNRDVNCAKIQNLLNIANTQ